MQTAKIDVCLSPELLHLYDLQGTIVVVTDILRATSCIVTAFAQGVKAIVPVREINECLQMKEQGYIVAAEREGKKVEGFDLGNSPFSYMDDSLKGKAIALTTTNGTQAIKLSENAKEILVGAFLNLETIANYLKNENTNVLVVCAGWKGKVNMEDTLFAGALVEQLSDNFSIANDAALMAKILYQKTKSTLLEVLLECSHVQRLKNLGIEKDIVFCLQHNIYQVVPKMQQGELVAHDFMQLSK
ncbi:MAG: 2-phosphosulfolactate phosphatase family protein [Raineya sp.]